MLMTKMQLKSLVCRRWFVLLLIPVLAIAVWAATWVADLYFRVNPNGFGFDNYGLTTAGGQTVTNLTKVEMARLFGDTQVYRTPVSGQVLTAPAAEWMKNTNSSMSGGHCEGMAVLSLLFYLKVVPETRYHSLEELEMRFQKEYS